LASLIRHLMWADGQAQRARLAVWGVVLLVQAGIFAAGQDGLASSFTRVNYSVGIAVVRFGWTIIAAALLVQSDALVGSAAFWMTRPIPRAALLTAKLLSAALWFVAAPVAVMAVVLLLLGLNPYDALAGGAAIGLEQAVILAMAVMAALVTANIGQVVVAGIAGVTLVSTFSGILLPAVTRTWPSVGVTLGDGQPVVYAVAVIAGGLVVAACHYLTLRPWRTVALAAAAMCLATVAARLWPAPPAVPDMGPVPESVMSTSAVSLTASSLVPRIEDAGRVLRGKPITSKRVGVETRSAGHPPGIYFWPVAVATEIRFSALAPIYWSGPSTRMAGERAPRDDYESREWRSIRLALGDVDLAAPGRLRSFTAVADIPEAEFHAHTFMPGRLKTDITMIAYRYEVTAAVPLEAGASFSAPGRSGRILSVTRLNLGVRIGLRETSLAAPRTPGQNESGTSWYILRNRTERSAVPLKWMPVNRCVGTVGISATGVTMMRGALEVEIPQEFAQRFNLDAAWLAGAELVLVESRPLGLLTRPLTVDNFVIGASAESRTPLATPKPESPGAGKGGNPEPRPGGVR
jgi:hypothetical protein